LKHRVIRITEDHRHQISGAKVEYGEIDPCGRLIAAHERPIIFPIDLFDLAIGDLIHRLALEPLAVTAPDSRWR
jgi:hypothetical protein